MQIDIYPTEHRSRSICTREPKCLHLINDFGNSRFRAVLGVVQGEVQNINRGRFRTTGFPPMRVDFASNLFIQDSMIRRIKRTTVARANSLAGRADSSPAIQIEENFGHSIQSTVSATLPCHYHAFGFAIEHQKE